VKAVPVNDPQEYDDLLARQRSAVSRQQAPDLGLTSGAVVARLATGELPAVARRPDPAAQGGH
jgi:hypothetical protein